MPARARRIIDDMQIPYRKMHGTGNRILIVDQRIEKRPPPGVEKIREWGNDQTGPGFDQMMWINPARSGSSVASYRVFNTDGSEVEQCGNGVRCVARYLADLGLPEREFELQSPAGLISARVFDNGEVAVSMGSPDFEPSRIPFMADSVADKYTLDADGTSIEIGAVSMGNPHAVIEVESVSMAPVQSLGPTLEKHARFPQKCNVGFMHIQGRRAINLRVFERGVGETAACGTGACAAVVIGRKRGALDEVVDVHLPGGKVVVSWHGPGTPVWLRGNAELINEGMLEL
ncbi:MAG: diaminopimelate epimerase [Gammaproteobacteria bacterium]|nr:diaminopimelate epimerase [Gammaproteobacteria bacterium]MDH5240692.1 diaminopimelate epimerase [Gammaproteobacteria bacterium]MDH5261325.1 diaminopimelate epimerase [Gammaproteobacteria bacterium]MDH5583124.1 diaminopimelate epimerase [Gammaproteobacteria bacterium]